MSTATGIANRLLPLAAVSYCLCTSDWKQIYHLKHLLLRRPPCRHCTDLGVDSMLHLNHKQIFKKNLTEYKCKAQQCYILTFMCSWILYLHQEKILIFTWFHKTCQSVAVTKSKKKTAHLQLYCKCNCNLTMFRFRYYFMFSYRIYLLCSFAPLNM